MKVVLKVLFAYIFIFTIIYYKYYTNDNYIENCESGKNVSDCSIAIQLLKDGDDNTKKNPYRAYELAKKGCALNDKISCYQAGVLIEPTYNFTFEVYKPGIGTEDLSLKEFNKFGLKIDKTLSVSYKEKSCNLNYTLACLTLGQDFKSEGDHKYENKEYNPSIFNFTEEQNVLENNRKNDIENFNITQKENRLNYFNDYSKPYLLKAKENSLKNCDNNDGYECRLLGLILAELHEDKEEIIKAYTKGCELEDSISCSQKKEFNEKLLANENLTLERECNAMDYTSCFALGLDQSIKKEDSLNYLSKACTGGIEKACKEYSDRINQ